MSLAWAAMVSTLGVIGANLVAGHGPSVLLRLIGVVLLLASPFFFIPPFVVLARRGRPDGGGSYMDTSTVVRRGPYRIVRHPQYLGYILLDLGFALRAQSPVAGALAAFSIACWVAVAVEEERHLRSRHGEAYSAYCAEVPRFNVVAGLLRCVRSPRRDDRDSRG